MYLFYLHIYNKTNVILQYSSAHWVYLLIEICTLNTIYYCCYLLILLYRLDSKLNTVDNSDLLVIWRGFLVIKWNV